MNASRQVGTGIIVVLVLVAVAALPLGQSVDDALRDLHLTQAAAGNWDGFQPGSSVTYFRVGKTRNVGDYREKITQVMTERTPIELSFEIILADGEHLPGPLANVSAAALVARNARRIGAEDLFIGQKEFHAVVYQFNYHRYGKSYEQTYWLAPGAPDGVIQHREKVLGIVDPEFSSDSTMKVTDLNVELKAGTRTVRGYCFETEEGARGAKFTRDRICRSKEVPGALVTAEHTELDGTVESEHVRQTVESFKAIR